MSEKEIKLPHMHKVKSSTITEVGHDGDTLHVKFRGGGHYSYSGVSKDIYGAMLQNESIGKFFHSNVKGKFDHTNHTPKKEGK